MGYIYKLTFPSGHYYIGQTRRYKQRLQDHLSYLARGAHKSPQVQEAYDTHGKPTLEIIQETDDPLQAKLDLLKVHYGQPFCLNRSDTSTPILTRDKTSRSNLKTKDVENVRRLLKILPKKKVCDYYKVFHLTLQRYCKEFGIEYPKEYTGPLTNPHKLKLTEERLVEFLLDSPRYNAVELSKKYGVSRATIYNWQDKYSAMRKPNPIDGVYPFLFLRQAESMTDQQLAAAYRVSEATIEKWKKDFRRKD